eukprot:9432244-Lingulodinium_polyedra.AAC.1
MLPVRGTCGRGLLGRTGTASRHLLRLAGRRRRARLTRSTTGKESRSRLMSWYPPVFWLPPPRRHLP